jgi:hypothetical protein
MAKLRNSVQAALHLGKLRAFLVISLDQVGDGQKVRESIALGARELLDLLTQDNANTFKKGHDESILVAKNYLAEQRVLLGSLISKKQDVRHLAWAELEKWVVRLEYFMLEWEEFFDQVN